MNLVSVTEILACPLCRQTLKLNSGFCSLCEDYYKKELQKINTFNNFLDLTPFTRQAQEKPLRTQLFQNPLVAFFYERFLPTFWAAGLRQIGGIEQEFKLVQHFFRFSEINIVVDLSCGTGIIARRLAQNNYTNVVAVDYSAAMLDELRDRMRHEKILPSQITLIRADVEALPFINDSIDAIYAGAAIHCWQDAQKSVNEVYRVMKVGGKLLATTFIKPFPSIVFQFFSLSQLRKIFLNAGFKNSQLKIEVNGLYAVIKGIK